MIHRTARQGVRNPDPSVLSLLETKQLTLTHQDHREDQGRNFVHHTAPPSILHKHKTYYTMSRRSASSGRRGEVDARLRLHYTSTFVPQSHTTTSTKRSSMRRRCWSSGLLVCKKNSTTAYEQPGTPKPFSLRMTQVTVISRGEGQHLQVPALSEPQCIITSC